MHLKSKTEHLKQDSSMMANINDDDNGSRTSNSNNNNNNNENSGGGGSSSQIVKNNNNNNSISSNNNNNSNVESGSIKNATIADAGDPMELKVKKQALEQRKQELEKLLSEKSWLLQQIQKQEAQILNGNFEYLNFNDIFASLAQQYKQEQEDAGGCVSTSGVLRRKSKSSASKENQSGNANNNRVSEISNRSSEYDNYPRKQDDISIGKSCAGMECVDSVTQQQVGIKNAVKKRSTTSSAASMTYLQLQRQHMLQQHVEQQMLQQHLKYVPDPVTHHQQQQSQKIPGYLHYHPNQSQHQHAQQHPKQFQHSPQHQSEQVDAISLYSVNSANIATLRQQHIAPQQQPIVVQCDKYYLSPTHQNYNDGSFIKSSQNIKKYVSPLSSPTQGHYVSASTIHEQPAQSQRHLHQQQHNVLPLQQLQAHGFHHYPQHQFDAISLAPASYATLNHESPGHNLRWRSQLNIPQHSSSTQPLMQMQDVKSNSSDLLSQLSPATTGSNFGINYFTHTSNFKTKPFDEISVSSLNSEMQQQQKRTKKKQWLESSLDGPVTGGGSILSTASPNLDLQAAEPITIATATAVVQPAITRLLPLPTHTHTHTNVSHVRERAKLSSQSMSSGRHYSMSSQKNPHTRQFQDDDGRYMKLSQSTSYLNAIDTNVITLTYQLDATPIDLPQFKNLPPKPSVVVDIGASGSNITQPAPPPRPPRPSTVIEKSNQQSLLGTATGPGIGSTPLSPDIRIESPKNMTVVQQATFQPYKEITKPFEMSDFYKYSTKFRQKEAANAQDQSAH